MVKFSTLCIRHFGQDTDYSFSPITFTSNLWMIRGETLLIWVTESKVKVNFGTLCIRLCEQDTDSFSPIFFKFHMYVSC